MNTETEIPNLADLTGQDLVEEFYKALVEASAYKDGTPNLDYQVGFLLSVLNSAAEIGSFRRELETRTACLQFTNKNQK